MKRLIAFGCSNTLGEALPDCVANTDPARNRPSVQAWPAQLSQRMRRECVNLGHGGASNKFIADRVLNFDFAAADCAVILWTDFARWSVFRQQHCQRLLPTDCGLSSVAVRKMAADKKQTRFYYKHLHTETDSVFNSFAMINLVKLLLDQQQIENHHFAWTEPLDNTAVPRTQPKWNSIDLELVQFHTALGTAEDNVHPSAAAHAAMADTMLHKITAGPKAAERPAPH